MEWRGRCEWRGMERNARMETQTERNVVGAFGKLEIIGRAGVEFHQEERERERERERVA